MELLVKIFVNVYQKGLRGVDQGVSNLAVSQMVALMRRNVAKAAVDANILLIGFELKRKVRIRQNIHF